MCAAALVGALAASGGDPALYASLELPAWAPPSWLFSPVWAVLYVAIAVAAWLVARSGLDRTVVRAALAVFAVHLVLQAAWTPLFFGAEAFGWALADIVATLVTGLVAGALMARASRTAGALMGVYALWLAYATALNTAVVALN